MIMNKNVWGSSWSIICPWWLLLLLMEWWSYENNNNDQSDKNMNDWMIMNGLWGAVVTRVTASSAPRKNIFLKNMYLTDLFQVFLEMPATNVLKWFLQWLFTNQDKWMSQIGRLLSQNKKAATTAFHVGDSSANLSNQILGKVCFQGFSLSKRIGIKWNSDVSHLKIHF